MLNNFGAFELTFAVLTQAGVNDVASEYAQQQLAALDVRKRFKPLTVLKANKGKAAPGVTLAQRPTRGNSCDWLACVDIFCRNTPDG